MAGMLMNHACNCVLTEKGKNLTVHNFLLFHLTIKTCHSIISYCCIWEASSNTCASFFIRGSKHLATMKAYRLRHRAFRVASALVDARLNLKHGVWDSNSLCITYHYRNPWWNTGTRFRSITYYMSLITYYYILYVTNCMSLILQEIIAEGHAAAQIINQVRYSS